MSLSDTTAPFRHSTAEHPGLVATLIHWLSHDGGVAARTEPPANNRARLHGVREEGYLHDIGI
jgi:hypothetical protein